MRGICFFILMVISMGLQEISGKIPVFHFFSKLGMKDVRNYFSIKVVNVHGSFGILSFFPYLWPKGAKVSFENELWKISYLFGAITSMKNEKFKTLRLITLLRFKV